VSRYDPALARSDTVTMPIAAISSGTVIVHSRPADLSVTGTKSRPLSLEFGQVLGLSALVCFSSQIDSLGRVP
jgi:hypothetical protein